VVLDLYSGLVVGWSMSPQQDRQLVIQAVLMAVWQRLGRTPVILHSDRGCQFTSEEYQRFLEAHQVICSMSAVGSGADNAAAESFFGVLKRERVNRHHYRTRAEARADIFRLYRALSQSPTAPEARLAATGGTTLKSTVRENGVEPSQDFSHQRRPLKSVELLESS
jgi:transposase InsO family protein